MCLATWHAHAQPSPLLQGQGVRAVTKHLQDQYVGKKGSVGYDLRARHVRDNVVSQAKVTASNVSNRLFFALLVMFALSGFATAMTRAWLAHVGVGPGSAVEASAIEAASPGATAPPQISTQRPAVDRVDAIFVIAASAILVGLVAAHWGTLLSPWLGFPCLRSSWCKGALSVCCFAQHPIEKDKVERAKEAHSWLEENEGELSWASRM